MTTLDHNGTPKSVQSPFFIAATGMTIALIVVAAVVALIS